MPCNGHSRKSHRRWPRGWCQRRAWAESTASGSLSGQTWSEAQSQSGTAPRSRRCPNPSLVDLPSSVQLHTAGSAGAVAAFLSPQTRFGKGGNGVGGGTYVVGEDVWRAGNSNLRGSTILNSGPWVGLGWLWAAGGGGICTEFGSWHVNSVSVLAFGAGPAPVPASLGTRV